MKHTDLTERKRVNYRRVTRSGLQSGVGTVVETYQTMGKWNAEKRKSVGRQWLCILHDKANGRTVTVYPSQCTPIKRGKAPGYSIGYMQQRGAA